MVDQLLSARVQNPMIMLVSIAVKTDVGCYSHLNTVLQCKKYGFIYAIYKRQGEGLQ